MRKCTACKGPIVIHEALGFGPIGSIIGIGGLASWWLLRALGLAAVLAIGGICGLVSAVFMAWRCSLCKKRPPRSFLNREEKKTSWLRRLGFVLGAALCFAGAFVLLALELGSGRFR
jgi:hypothetical protein